MKLPKVSVVTPTFNRAGFLPETIESIINQSYGNFEYIIVDDGSTDNTRDVVRCYEPLVQYVRQENRGEASATNLGWQLSAGDYFCMVSSDDPMLPGWLDRCVRFMEENEKVDIAYPDWLMIDCESHKIREVETYDYSQEKLIGWLHCLPGPGTIIRKCTLSGVTALRDPSFRLMPDMESWMRLSLRCHFARIPETLATWRFHGDSISVAQMNMRRAVETFRMVVTFFLRPGLPPHIKRLRYTSMARALNLMSIFVADSNPAWSRFFSGLSWRLDPTDDSDLPTEIRRVKTTLSKNDRELTVR